MLNALTDDERIAALAALPAWSHDIDRKALFRRLSFATFGEALAAMVRIGVEAEKRDHHPEWTNIYATIDIWLTTHDAGGISSRDVELATVIDSMFREAASA